MIKGGYSENYANHRGHELLGKVVVKELIKENKAVIEAEDGDSRVFIDNQFKALLIECNLKHDRVNAARCLENMAKNRGYYAADNAQRVEKAALDQQEAKEAQKIATILNLEDARSKSA